MLLVNDIVKKYYLIFSLFLTSPHMKSITVTEAGPADSMKVVELPSSSPKAHEVVIGQTYAGVNYGDAIRRKRGLFKLNEHGYFMP